MALLSLLPCILIPSLLLLLQNPGEAATICFIPNCGRGGLSNWTFEAGVATITDASINDLASPKLSLHQASGPGAGTIYSLTTALRLGELRWEIGGHTFTPRLEVPLTLEIVDENARRPFLDFNSSFAVRWVDFPWNECVKTTFAMGIGLSYSEHVYLIDQERHPGDDRSKLKFNWPIQLTLAHPDYPGHQLMFFIAHQSGGHVFDVGGVNSLGIGYRHEF